ncbi:hypothetical protein JTB14_007815 [Gonioctena quinquepunctata]|nr:hypothetical protein JTB14_007815 [Gonioctena quinquepunctata]
MSEKAEKTNGTEVKTAGGDSSENDPCLEDSKRARKTDFFHRYRDEISDRSGLSYRGVYIVGGIVILAMILLIVVVSLASVWPRIPHEFQFPICEKAECLKAAAQIREALDSSISPCDDLWNSTCGGWLKKYPLPRDKSVWNMKQQLVRREAERVRDRIATLKLPLHTSTVEWKLKHLYEGCMDVDTVNTDVARPLTNIISELGFFTELSNAIIDIRQYIEKSVIDMSECLIQYWKNSNISSEEIAFKYLFEHTRKLCTIREGVFKSRANYD